MGVMDYDNLKDHKCILCGKEVYRYQQYYTVSTHRKTKVIFHAECMGKEITKNATGKG